MSGLESKRKLIVELESAKNMVESKMSLMNTIFETPILSWLKYLLSQAIEIIKVQKNEGKNAGVIFEFEEIDIKEIKGEVIFYVPNPITCIRNFSWLIGCKIKHDEKIYEITSVESYATYNIRRGDRIGLRVEKINLD